MAINLKKNSNMRGFLVLESKGKLFLARGKKTDRPDLNYITLETKHRFKHCNI
jgi:hypothetical protein